MEKYDKNDMEIKIKKALEITNEEAKKTENWIELHNVMLGIDGKVTDLFKDKTKRNIFCGTPEFKKIQDIISNMREKFGDPPPIGRLDHYFTQEK